MKSGGIHIAVTRFFTGLQNPSVAKERRRDGHSSAFRLHASPLNKETLTWPERRNCATSVRSEQIKSHSHYTQQIPCSHTHTTAPEDAVFLLIHLTEPLCF